MPVYCFSFMSLDPTSVCLFQMTTRSTQFHDQKHPFGSVAPQETALGYHQHRRVDVESGIRRGEGDGRRRSRDDPSQRKSDSSSTLMRPMNKRYTNETLRKWNAK